ncbi:hypothetical protein FRC07_005255 [Ceratobasidium sp. 392]|nr:hypothetical protein FRC07_005255 [Ceratobasidium sp. 392]
MPTTPTSDGTISDKEGQLEDDAANAAVDTKEELPEVTAADFCTTVLNSSTSSDLILPRSNNEDCAPQLSLPIPANVPVRPRRSARLSQK